MYERIQFGGLEVPRDPPRSYQRLQKRHDAEYENTTFRDILDRLKSDYNIEWRDLFYGADVADDADVQPKKAVDHYRALVNPMWESIDSAEIPGDRDDAVWHIPTKKYRRVPHHQAIEPVADAISRRDLNVFGTCRVRREGGEVHLDLFFESFTVPHDTDDIVLGISTGQDYYGNCRLYVEVIAYHDTGDGVGQVQRYLFDPKRRKHTGEAAEQVIEWYGNALDRLPKVSDKLHNVVADAMTYEFPLGEYPSSIVGFFKHLGFPNREPNALADPAGQRAVETAVGPYTAWHLHKAAVWAIEHHYDSRDTSAFKKHMTTANTLLFNPALAEKQALKSMEEAIETDDDQSEVWEYVEHEDDPTATLDTIRTRAKSVSEGVEDFEDTRKRIQQILEDDGVLERDVDAESESESGKTESEVEA